MKKRLMQSSLILMFLAANMVNAADLSCHPSEENTFPDFNNELTLQADLKSIAILANEAEQAICTSQYLSTGQNKGSYEDSVRDFASALPGKVSALLAQQEAIIGENASNAVPISDYVSVFNSWSASLSDFPEGRLEEFHSTANDGVLTLTMGDASGEVDFFACSEQMGMNCKRLFDAIGEAINGYANTQKVLASAKLNARVEGTMARWERYYEKGRAQTILDEFVSYQFNKSHYTQSAISGPAKVQYFFLHPSLLVENVPDAVKGHRTEFSLGVEVIGFNMWDWKVPFGMSATVVYTDRVGVSDFGYGPTLHFYNAFSVGYNFRGHGDGFYFDVNLTEWLTNKAGKYRETEAKIRALRDKLPQS
ncbi:hypothetical protein [Vibrio sp. FJH11]